MKKILVSVLLVGISYTSNSQELLNENFDESTVGDFALEQLELSKLTSAQGEWVVSSADPALDQSFFQIVSEAQGDNRLELKGSSTTPISGTNNNYSQKVVKFSDRQNGNDVVQLEFNFNTGASSVSTNEISFNIMDATRGFYYAGFTYYSSTRKIEGYVFDSVSIQNKGLAPSALGNGNTDLILQNNTNYNCSLVFDFITGEISWNIALSSTPTTKLGHFEYVTSAQIDPDKFALFAIKIKPGTGNTASKTISVDDIKITALKQSPNAGIAELSVANFSIFPNPVTDVVTVSIQPIDLGKMIYLTSLDGKNIEKREITNVAEKFDVSSLKAGVYFFQIGTATQKIVVQ